MVTDDDSALPPAFPIAEAQALATRLDRCADLLGSAADARSRAERDLADFQCAEADTYRDNLGDYVLHAQDVVDRFRRTANRLRDNADEILQQWSDERQEAIDRPSR